MSAYAGGCYSTNPADKRVKSNTALFQDGWRVMRRGEIITREPVMREFTTPWQNTVCMKLAQANYTDHECAGCVHE